MNTKIYFFILLVIATMTTSVANAQNYILTIAGVEVNSGNASNITGPGISGSVSYDHSTKTLTLHDATIITPTVTFGIMSEIEGFTINLIGNNRVEADPSAISFYSTGGKITGSGTVTANSINQCGIYISQYNSLLISDNCTIIANGKWGIAGLHGNNETLTIDNATVKATGTIGSIADLKSLTLNNASITQPEGATFSESLKAVALNGQVVNSEVMIQPTTTQENYELWVSGTQVTSANASNITGNGISGSISYNNDTKTLRLNDVTVNTTTENSIFSKIEGLIIELVGDNNVSANSPSVYLYKPATIIGEGSLTTNSANDCGIFLWSGSSLVVSGGCTVIVNGKWGIAGVNDATEALAIDNSTVKSTGTSGSICDIKSLTLNSTSITQPEGAEFVPSLRGVALNGAIVKTEVIIEPTGSGIESFQEAGISAWGGKGMMHIDLSSARNNAIQIYHVSGKLVHTIEAQNATSLQIPLQPSMYIVRIGNAVGKVMVY